MCRADASSIYTSVFVCMFKKYVLVWAWSIVGEEISRDMLAVFAPCKHGTEPDAQPSSQESTKKYSSCTLASQGILPRQNVRNFAGIELCLKRIPALLTRFSMRTLDVPT